jgi:predicted alpha/beta-fold hydrolase
MRILAGGFRPHPLLRNRHVQTLWYHLGPSPPAPSLDWERLELPDGDFIDLCWSAGNDGPIVLILHGLNGNLRSLKTIYDFDDRITAPLHGFDGADDYYARASSRQFLASIRIPTLVLHALDDPFMTPAGIPRATELAESVVLELTAQGGHMGFVHAGSAFLPRF